MGSPVPSVDNIGRLRALGLPQLALGSFALAPGKDAAMDQRVVIRTNTIHSPYGSSFAGYLKETLATDFKAAGALDPSSGIVISGLLTNSVLDVPVGAASAVVAARFVVSRGGVAVFDKELRASSTWHAPFIAVEALPMAMNRYGQLYRELAGMLLDDPEFQAAIRR